VLVSIERCTIVSVNLKFDGFWVPVKHNNLQGWMLRTNFTTPKKP